MEHNMVYHLKNTMCSVQWINGLNPKITLTRQRICHANDSQTSVSVGHLENTVKTNYCKIMKTLTLL